ncbi:MAG: DUF5606 domain-containing protein [Aquirufa sp.]
MELLNEIAHISGKSGLYKVLKPTRTGVIVETLDQLKQRSVVSGQTRISVLKDISLYLDDHQDSTLPLADLFNSLHEKFNGKLTIEPKKATDMELFATIAEVVPNYDADRVYASDIKKILSWYLILVSNTPEIFKAVEVAPAEKAEKPVKEKAPKAEKVAKEKAPAKKK